MHGIDRPVEGLVEGQGARRGRVKSGQEWAVEEAVVFWKEIIFWEKRYIALRNYSSYTREVCLVVSFK